MKTRNNLPLLVVLAGFALERVHYLFLEQLFQARLGSWARVDYVQARQSYDRLLGLGLVQIGRRGFEITEKAERFFSLRHAETGSAYVEPRNADETILIPESPIWSNQIPAMFMYEEDCSPEGLAAIAELAS